MSQNKYLIRAGLLVALLWLILPLRAATSFAEVSKIFAQHCLDCHAVDDPEGGLVLETFDLLMRGGESGPAILPGKSSESLLALMIEGKYQKDGKTKVMPPGKRDKLKSEEISLIKAWIDEGAKAPAEPIVVTREIKVPKIEPKVPPRRPIHFAAYSAPSKQLALGRSGEVEVHSAESQTLLRTLSGPAGNVNAIAWSPDGQKLYAAGGDPGLEGEIRVWNAADGSLIRTISGHRDAIYSLAISPDGKTLATGSYDQKIKLWNAETGEEIRTLSGHNGCVYALAFRADGKIIASASGDRTIKLWETASGERRDTLSQPLKEQYTVAFSPDGKRLAAAGVDNRIRVWEISDEARETTNPLLHSKFAHESPILRLAFSNDGKSLVSSAEDKTVKIWNFDDLKERRLLEVQPDWAPALAFILDDKGAAVGRLDGSLAYYDQQSGQKLAPPKPEIARLEPRGIQRGTNVQLKIIGKNLQGLTAVKAADARIKAELVSASSTEAIVAISSEANLPRAAYELTVQGSSGEIKSKLHIDDLPQFYHHEGRATLPRSLPVTLWSTHQNPGQIDTFEFEATAGETIVFDAAAKMIGSKAELVLSLVDAEGRTLASDNAFDKTGDPLIAHKFQHSGKYKLIVSESILAGSADHFYRVSVGAFPFVTAVYPAIAAEKTDRPIELVGYNLEGSPLLKQLDPERFRFRNPPRVQTTTLPDIPESEPNDAYSRATLMPAPGVANGRMLRGDNEDWFRFESKAGQHWIIETAADQIGSPMDTKIQIFDSHGKPVLRTLLQAVRDSAVTFRGIDSTTVDCRVDNWEEMELNQYLYLNGEVVRLFRAPQGPDSGFNFYSLNGKRRNYFDTTATTHANAEPCYIVEPRSPSEKLVQTGLPTFEIYYQNDDDAERKLGPDSKVHFTAPANETYLVRVSDTRGFTGDRYIYTLTLREAQPDFKISIDGMGPTIPKGSGQRFAVNASRSDGFEGEIKIDVNDIPAGFTVSNPIIVQAGHTTAFGTINAAEDAIAPTNSILKFTATAQINGKTVNRDAGNLGTIKLADSASLYVALEPSGSAAPEITIAPGTTIPAHLKIRRNGHTELVTFQVENLPHGIIVDNIGLNGVLIPKDQNEREVFFAAARWVPETDRLCYAVSNEAGRQTSRPVLVKVRRSAGQVATR